MYKYQVGIRSNYGTFLRLCSKSSYDLSCARYSRMSRVGAGRYLGQRLWNVLLLKCCCSQTIGTCQKMDTYRQHNTLKHRKHSGLFRIQLMDKICSYLCALPPRVLGSVATTPGHLVFGFNQGSLLTLPFEAHLMTYLETHSSS